MKFCTKPNINIIFASLICLALGMLSGKISHAGDTAWYQSLLKPTFNPPSWIFSPVWTILYIMLGMVAIRLWNLRKTNKAPFNLFFIQIILNYAWSPAFFYLHDIRLALAILLVMWFFTLQLIMQLKAQKQKTIILLLMPYFAWISFALLLNFKIMQLNPGK